MEKNNNINNFLNNMPKLRWACRRGMLELDVLLNNFLEKKYLQLTEDDKKLFVQLLNYSDPELFAWVLGHQIPKEKWIQKIINVMRQYAQS